MNKFEDQTNARHVLINTDGACSGNPGPGGWAATLRRMVADTEVKFRSICGGSAATTNNQMELEAAIQALRLIGSNIHDDPIIVRSDSQYLIKGMNEWRHKWEANGWRKADKKPVQNVEQWRTLVELADGKTIEWEWVRGHSGDLHNEEVDRLASDAIGVAMFQ